MPYLQSFARAQQRILDWHQASESLFAETSERSFTVSPKSLVTYLLQSHAKPVSHGCLGKRGQERKPVIPCPIPRR